MYGAVVTRRFCLIPIERSRCGDGYVIEREQFLGAAAPVHMAPEHRLDKFHHGDAAA